MATDVTPSGKLKRHLLGIVLLSIGITVFFSLGQTERPVLIFYRFLVVLVISASMWLGNGYITDMLDRKVSWLHSAGLRFMLGVSATIVYTSLITLLILEGLLRFTNTRMTNEGYWTSFWITVSITVVITLILHARAFLLNWKKSDLDRERLEKAHVASQYEALRNQVNPHFLFNSLNVLSELVHQDADLAEKFIAQLSKVYRYVLENRDTELVPLAEEARFIEGYLFLQKIRHADALQVRWDLQDTHLQLPPMALQLLVENALKHNVLTTDRPLSLEIRQEGDALLVENTLQLLDIPNAGTGMGLNHLKKRYSYLTERPMTIEETDSHYRVSLPLLNPTEHGHTAG